LPIFTSKQLFFFTNRQKWRFEVSKNSLIFAKAMDLACRGINGQNVDAY
jgi:hypothetical protein